MSSFPCPTARALSILGGKWRASILGHLKQGDLHHGELRRLLPGISQKVLTQTLRDLEAAGLITRTPVPGRVPRVRYGLVDVPFLRDALQALYDLGLSWETGVPPIHNG